MEKLNKILLIAVCVLFIALTITGRYARTQRDERKRLDKNQATLLSDIDHYKVRDSLNAVSVGQLTLRESEFKRHFSDLEQLVRDMGLRLKRVENISQNALESRYDIEAAVRDTSVIIMRPDTSSILQGKVIRYQDPHLLFDGVILNDEFKGSVITYDTLTQVVHRIPRKFLFIRWGTKELRQEIVSSNPHSRITYSKTITLQR